MKSVTPLPDLPASSDLEVGSSIPLRNFPGLTAADRAPHEEILHRAYAIWEREGEPEGRTLAHWLEAEAEILPPGEKSANP